MVATAHWYVCGNERCSTLLRENMIRSREAGDYSNMLAGSKIRTDSKLDANVHALQ